MATILWENYLPPALIALAFRNGIGYRYLNVRRQNNWNISGYTGPIFTIFSPYESASGAHDKHVPRFPICQWTLSWQSIDFGKYHERRLIPLAFFARSLENELQYHCLCVRFYSGDDVATSCKNLVNVCRITPEIMGLICRYLYLAKIDVYICICRAAIQKRHRAFKADGRINSGNYLATPGINLVGFRSV